jgi:hypothetical protein
MPENTSFVIDAGSLAPAQADCVVWVFAFADTPSPYSSAYAIVRRRRTLFKSRFFSAPIQGPQKLRSG